MVIRLAPRTCEGGVPALAQGRGEYEFPATERQIELSFCVCCSSSRAFVKDMRMTGSPRYQCVLLLPPPHKCGGQGRVPHPPAHHCPNSSTNSNFPVCCFTAAKSRAFTLRFVIGARKDRKFGRIMAASRWRAGEKRGKSPEKKCKIFKNILSFSNPLWYN